MRSHRSRFAADKPVILVLALLAFLAGWPNGLQAATSQPLAQQADTILQQRCMVCHGCYDAPCQLKLEAHKGLRRGATEQLVYDGSRLRRANLTRLFDDGQSEAQWRAKGFYPVLDPRQAERGVLYRMLELKKDHPLPANGAMPRGFDLSLYRDQQCPRQDEFDSYARDYPLWGMPYGLPGLNVDEHRTMISWLELGAPAPVPAPLTSALQGSLDEWELFLNGDSSKQQLMSRYLYEHLFLAALYLRTEDQPEWFRLVRSRTPPGKQIDLVVTRRPYDHPGTGQIFYRLQRMPVTPLAKIHMPYRFDDARRQWYDQLFLQSPYKVSTLPGYEPEVGANPFKSFNAMPVHVRYRFLLAEAEFTIMNFIKGSVCRGQIALNVIDDQFWVMFIDPYTDDNSEYVDDFLSGESDNLRIPVAKRGTLVDLLAWRGYAKGQRRYQQAKSDYLAAHLKETGSRLGLDIIWDGDGVNPNAALTVFRHLDTATVVKGFVGGIPKTAWVIDYALLERIHYLLVAGFDVYGAASHQLESRLYMDFLRMEAEYNFLLLMPPDQRVALRKYWYRDARGSSQKYFADQAQLKARPSDIQYTSDDPKTEFLRRQRRRIHGATAENFDYRSGASKQLVSAFEKLEAAVGAHNSFLPQVSFVNVIGDRRDEVYSFVRNSGYSNIAQPFREQERRLPLEDSLTIASGFLGAYPNYFFQINESQLPAFTTHILSLASEADYLQFIARYGVNRNASWFWHLSDKLHQVQHSIDPISAGLFDYNRYHSH